MSIFRNLWNDDDGQDVVEYALIAGLVSVIAYAVIKTTGAAVNTVWTNVSSDIQTAT